MRGRVGKAGKQPRESPSCMARRAGACYLSEQTPPLSLSSAHTCGFNNHHIINTSCLGKQPLPGRPQLSAASPRPAQDCPAPAPGLWGRPLAPTLVGVPGDSWVGPGIPGKIPWTHLSGTGCWGRGEGRASLLR